MATLNHGNQPNIQRGSIEAMDSLGRLKALGFVECCEWVPDSDKIVSKFADRCLDRKYSVCALVVDDVVMYIDTSMKRLRVRMLSFCKLEPSRTTYTDCKENLCNDPNPARRVQIYVLWHTELLCCSRKNGPRTTN